MSKMDSSGDGSSALVTDIIWYHQGVEIFDISTRYTRVSGLEAIGDFYGSCCYTDQGCCRISVTIVIPAGSAFSAEEITSVCETEKLTQSTKAAVLSFLKARADRLLEKEVNERVQSLEISLHLPSRYKSLVSLLVQCYDVVNRSL
jgi:hypothetical protein